MDRACYGDLIVCRTPGLEESPGEQKAPHEQLSLALSLDCQGTSGGQTLMIPLVTCIFFSFLRRQPTGGGQKAATCAPTLREGGCVGGSSCLMGWQGGRERDRSTYRYPIIEYAF